MPVTFAQDRNQTQTSIEAHILGFAAVRAWPEQLEQYRKQPAELFRRTPGTFPLARNHWIPKSWRAS